MPNKLSFSSEIQRLHQIVDRGDILDSKLKAFNSPPKWKSFLIFWIKWLPGISISKTSPRAVSKSFQNFIRQYKKDLENADNQISFEKLIEKQIVLYQEKIQANPQKFSKIQATYRKVFETLPQVIPCSKPHSAPCINTSQVQTPSIPDMDHKILPSYPNGSTGSIKPKAVFSDKVDSTKISFAAFIVELENEIFPLYEKHETGFDKHRIHGRMHIARAVIFGEIMARYYQNKGQSVDFGYVRRTIGLHDAGRKGNGVDRWEKESSELLCNHLISKNILQEEAEQKSNIIIKENADKTSFEFKIFQSADCLDIMRPCTGNGGREGFNPKYLTFLENSESDELQFRKNLIEEAWFLIKITENKKMTEFNESKGFMDKLFQIIREHQVELPILFSIL